MFKRTLMFCCAFLVALSIQAEENPRFVEGQHYQVLSTPLKTSYRGSEVGEIMEFFSYGCIHCYNLEPAIARFLADKPENIRFTGVPVMFNERQEPEVRAYYVQQTLKLGDEAHQAIFSAIHKDRVSLRTDKQFAKFFADNLGVSEDKYMQTAYSFGVDPLVKKSIYLTGTSGIGGTPSIVANGKYLIDSGAVGGNEMALYAAKWLVERDAAAQ